MSTSGTDTAEEGQRKKTIVYFVNGEEQTTDERKLTAEQILAAAGFEPTAEWQLSRDRDGHVFKNPTDEVEIHKDERFTATRTGPTETS